MAEEWEEEPEFGDTTHERVAHVLDEDDGGQGEFQDGAGGADARAAGGEAAVEDGAWQEFDTSTEVGRMLTKLYGNTRPMINYPTLKRRQDAPASDQKLQHSSRFLAGVNTNRTRDPRKTSRRNVNVAAPKFDRSRGRAREEAERNPLRGLPARRHENVIRDELRTIAERAEHYRPGYIKPVSTDEQKALLSERFTFKGGKALPEELTNPVGEMPSELRQRAAEKKRIADVRLRHRARQMGISVEELRRRENPPPKPAPPPLEQQDAENVHAQLAAQIREEIDERQNYIMDMARLGESDRHRTKQMQDEINSRMHRLFELEQQKKQRQSHSGGGAATAT